MPKKIFSFFRNYRWVCIPLLLSLCIGTAIAFFLHTLNWATEYQQAHNKLIYGLPIIGFGIGIGYHYFGKSIAGGNNLLLSTIIKPQKIIPFKMAPMVYIGTILTHLFGGSAGREGTGLQMAGAMADQLSKPFQLDDDNRSILIIVAVAGGFAAVFGTPLTGTIFALELLLIRKIALKAFLPALITAYGSDAVCRLWHVPHTHYAIKPLEAPSVAIILLVIAAGIIFGVCARLFTVAMHFCTKVFGKIDHEALRPAMGGLVILAAVLMLNRTDLIGLGIPTIVQSFGQRSTPDLFALKIAFTAITLGSGFKGGEVTPLFFIGATLGSALSFWLPLPVSMLAALGFVAVFAGATNTPFACAIMAAELFDTSILPYAFLVCLTAFLVSGTKGIYTDQPFYGKKHQRYFNFFRQRFRDL